MNYITNAYENMKIWSAISACFTHMKLWPAAINILIVLLQQANTNEQYYKFNSNLGLCYYECGLYEDGIYFLKESLKYISSEDISSRESTEECLADCCFQSVYYYYYYKYIRVNILRQFHYIKRY